MTRTALTAAALLCLAACSPSATQEVAAPAEQAPNREFAVFTQRNITLVLGDAPVAAPVTVGSRASPETVASDAPAVVAVRADGALVARQAGKVTLRGVGTGSTLAVVVIEPWTPGTTASRTGAEEAR